MIKVDIVNEVSKIADITKVKAEVAVDAVFDAMRLSMQRGERIELRGFGVFQVKPRKRGIGRNPRTGKEVRIPPGRTIRFKPGKDLQNIGGESAHPLRRGRLSGPSVSAEPFEALVLRFRSARRKFQSRLWLHASAAAAHDRHHHAGRRVSLRVLLSEFSQPSRDRSSWRAPAPGLLVQRHDSGDPRRPRDGALLCLPTITTSTRRSPFHSVAAVPLLTGTLGAVIRIREPFPTSTSLFDIGVAGPIAGFVVARPGAVHWHEPVERGAGADATGSVLLPGRAAALQARRRGRVRARSGRLHREHPSDGVRGLVRHAGDRAQPVSDRSARRRTHHVRHPGSLVHPDLVRHRHHRRVHDIRLGQLAGDDDHDADDALRCSARATRA